MNAVRQYHSVAEIFTAEVWLTAHECVYYDVESKSFYRNMYISAIGAQRRQRNIPEFVDGLRNMHFEEKATAQQVHSWAKAKRRLMDNLKVFMHSWRPEQITEFLTWDEWLDSVYNKNIGINEEAMFTTD